MAYKLLTYSGDQAKVTLVKAALEARFAEEDTGYWILPETGEAPINIPGFPGVYTFVVAVPEEWEALAMPSGVVEGSVELAKTREDILGRGRPIRRTIAAEISRLRIPVEDITTVVNSRPVRLRA